MLPLWSQRNNESVQMFSNKEIEYLCKSPFLPQGPLHVILIPFPSQTLAFLSAHLQTSTFQSSVLRFLLEYAIPMKIIHLSTKFKGTAFTFYQDLPIN